MTGRELYRFIRSGLETGGLSDTAEFEAKCIFKAGCGVDFARAVLENSQIGPEEQRLTRDMLARRLAGEPLQYVLGEWDFLGLPLHLDRGVLIPRADTEVLARRLIEKFKDRKEGRILDIGSGSGAIGVSAAFFIAKARITAMDISQPALQLTQKNARRHGVEDRVTAVKGDVFKGLAFDTPFDAIVSNPPYIPAGDIVKLDPSVRDFEPVTALDGGHDGLDFYRAIARLAPGSLKKGGWLLLEVGKGQAQEVVEILKNNQFKEIQILKDLSGIDRVVEGVKD